MYYPVARATREVNQLGDLGQGIPSDVSNNLDRLSTLISEGLALARKSAQNEVALGENLAGGWVKAQALALTEENFPAARRMIDGLYRNVIAWRDRVNLAAMRSGQRAQLEAEQRSSMPGQLLQTILSPFTLQAGPTGAPEATWRRWVIPGAAIAAVVGLLLLMRR